MACGRCLNVIWIGRAATSEPQSRDARPAPASAFPETSPNLRRNLAIATAAFLVVGYFVSIGIDAYQKQRDEKNRERRKATVKEANKVESITFYTPIEEITCATDPKFLDSSPLVSPANFVRVTPGTRLARVSFGGAFSGKMYYALSAGGEERIYVYRNTFESRFREAGTLSRDGR